MTSSPGSVLKNPPDFSAALCALVLGLLIWIATSDVTDIHILFGLLVTLGVLVMSIIALTARGLSISGIVSIVWAPIVLMCFGVTQVNLLISGTAREC